MPRSRRNKLVSLTKTGAKGKTLKAKFIETLREAVDEYERVYLFSIGNMRSAKLRNVRLDWKESKIFMGKNSVAQIAFGRSPEDEYKDNLRYLSKHLEGNIGILFTKRDHDEVVSYFSQISEPEFAVAGNTAEEDVVIPPGHLPFPVSMLDHLRTWGMIVEADDSKVILREPFVAAVAGEALTPSQAKVLVKMDMKTVEFTVQLLCKWEDRNFEEL